VLLPNSIAAALPPYGAGLRERWGYATAGRGPLLTRAARVPTGLRGRSQVFYYRAMLAGVGLEVSAVPDASLDWPGEWRERGAALLGASESGWIGLNPGAFYGGAKRWPPDRYAEVGDRLHRHTGARIALVGGPDERPLCEAIAGRLRAPSRVLAGRTTLEELLGVLAGLRLLVTNDSGPMHLAAALAVPLVAVFGPTDWRETAPWCARHRLVREAVECAPCGLRECPIDHRCMTRIDAARVAALAMTLLAVAERKEEVSA
jgi:heptosyltransferase-2